MIKNDRFLITVCLSLLLIFSIIQIFPDDVKIIQKASASSTWEDSNWSAPENYTTSMGIDIIPNSGDLKLLYSQGFFVADTYNNRIVKTNMNGSIWTTYGGSQGQFNNPYGICFDNTTSFIYVADYLNDRIVKTKLDGSGRTTYGSQGSGTGQFKGPSAISYDHNTGYIYVTDTYNNRIVKTKIDGTGWTTYGSQGNGIGQFNLPWGLCYDNKDGFIYVADSNNARIVKTKIGGTGWTTYGSFGTGVGQFGQPVQIDYDNNTGFVYVVDWANCRIVKTMINGSGWTTYGSQGSGIGQFYLPWGISYDKSNGFVYVADKQNNRIVRTMMNGSGWSTFGSNGNGTGEFKYPFGVTSYESSYCSEGFLTSRIFDCGAPSNFQSISWVADIPINTTIKFQLKTGCNLSNITSNDFIGPDGTKSTYYSTSGSTINSSHNGVRLVQYRVYLTTTDLSKTPILKDVTIIYNLLPNQPILTSPWNNNWTNNNMTTFTWTFNDTDSSMQKAFQWQASGFNDFIEIDYDSGPLISPTSSFIPVSAISDGIWYWRVRTKDDDGGWGPFSSSWKILIDTIAPSSKIIYPSYSQFYNRLDSISGLTLDSIDGSGVNKVELIINRITDNFYWDGTSWVKTESWLLISETSKWNYNSSLIPWTSGMEYQIRSRAIDNASNIEIPGEGNKFIYDAEEVIYSNAYPLANEISNCTELEVGITITDTISGVNASTIEYSISTNEGQNWTAWESIEKYENGKDINVKLNLTFQNGTGNRIRFRACDIAGNGPAYSDMYRINVYIPPPPIPPPITPTVKLLLPLNNTKVITTSVKFTWEVINYLPPSIVFDIKMETQNPPSEVIYQNYSEFSIFVDELENGKTYYWTVIPKIGDLNGTCLSGIWSFTVDIPLPRAILKTPANNSEIISTLPTLAWSLDYNGTETVTYDVYFGTNKDPPLEFEKLTITYYAIDTALQDNTTYYWKVVPWVGKYEGFSSELWSFTVKLKEDEKIPKFGINLYLNPNLLEIKPGEVKFVSAIVINLGEQNDNFTVTIGDINNTKLTAENYRQDTLEIEPGKNKEFLIMISVEENTKPGFENITIITTSRLAEIYNQHVQDSQMLSIKILKKDIQKERGQPISIFYFSILLFIIFLIIISIIIVILVRKKALKKENEEIETQDIQPETPPESITIPEPETTVEPLPIATQQQDETLEE